MSTALETTLSVENIRIRANHGWYVEERIMGGMYTINVHLTMQTPQFEGFEDLSSTVNYELIYAEVKRVMAQEHKLIEHCAKVLHDSLKVLSADGKWTVELIKEAPPIKHIGQTKFRIQG